MELPPGRIVALLGPRGTGKTQAAQNAIGATLNTIHGFDGRLFKATPRYTSAAKIFRAIRDAQKRGRDDDGLNEAQTVASFVNPPILVIDEAHERGETDFENRTLNEIIDDRYAARRTTILISNLSRAEFAKSIGPSIVSRIHECGETIECNWPSFRGKAS
jgi:DNA replication protein DnaC